MIAKLIKINFSQAFASLTRKKGQKGIILFVLMFIFVAVCMGFQFYDTGRMIPDKSFLFFISGVSAFFFLMFSLVLQSQNFFFHTKDYELLASMPVRKSEIVLSKSLAALLTCYIYQSIILIPSFVAVCIFNGFQVGMFFAFLLGFIIFPFFPLAISFLISMVMHLILSRSRFHTIVNYLLMGILFAGFFLTFYFLSDFALKNINVLKWVFPSIYLFFTGIAVNALNLLYLLLLGVGSLALSLALIIASYQFINQGNKSSTVKSGQLDFKGTSSLLKFEAKRYFSTPMYVFNTIIGPVLLLVVPFLKYIFGFQPQGFMVTLIICLILGLTSTTSCSISIEGSKINLLKSMPISSKKIFFNKILFNIILTLPSLFICDVLLLSINSYVWYEIIAILILPLIAITLFAIVGLIFNLYFPKLKFNSVNEVVKNSLSVFLAIFSSMVVNMLFLCLLPGFIKLDWVCLLSYGASLVVFLVIAIVILHTQGEKLFRKLTV